MMEKGGGGRVEIGECIDKLKPQTWLARGVSCVKRLGRAFLVEETVCKKAGAERARGSAGQNKADTGQ